MLERINSNQSNTAPLQNKDAPSRLAKAVQTCFTLASGALATVFAMLGVNLLATEMKFKKEDGTEYKELVGGVKPILELGARVGVNIGKSLPSIGTALSSLGFIPKGQWIELADRS